jgi:peptide/nickel transport system permease protein
VTRLLARRLLHAVPLLFFISALAFILIHAAPGGPLAIYLSSPNVRPEDIERLRRALGLDPRSGTRHR